VVFLPGFQVQVLKWTGDSVLDPEQASLRLIHFVQLNRMGTFGYKYIARATAGEYQCIHMHEPGHNNRRLSC
jgi:hypothetical protein